MPHRHRTPPALLEEQRCLTVTLVVRIALALIAAATHLLPKYHPARIYLEGRLVATKAVVLPALVPAADDPWRPNRHQAVKTLLVATLAITMVGEVSRAVPIDPFGIPDTNLGLHHLGFDDPQADSGPHVFGWRPPWAAKPSTPARL